MKGYVYIVLFAVTLLAPFAFRAGMGDGGGAGGAADGPRLVIITPNNQDIRQEFAWAFSAWHRARYGTPVACDFRVPGGELGLQRAKVQVVACEAETERVSRIAGEMVV